MPDAAHMTAFLAAAVVLAAAPGPGLLYVLARSLGGGTRAGVRSAAGTAAGGACHVVGAALGLSALLAASAVAFEVVRLAGAAYLVVLGVRTLAGLRRPAEAPGAPARSDRAFRQGVVTEVLNPKTALFFLTFLPQFTQPGHGPVWLQMLVLGALAVSLNGAADLAVALTAGRLGRALSRRPRVLAGQRAASGCALVALGAYAAASGSSR